jgi:AraC family transcriptional regulator
MFKNDPIAVNFQKEKNKALLPILPHAPVISSYQQQWQGISYEYHCQPQHETPEHYLEQHAIAINHIGDRPPLEASRTLNNRSQQEKVVDGDIVVIPAKTEHQSSWNRETQFTLLILEPKFVSFAAYETIDPDRVEILPHFAKSDPLIAQIGSALAAQMKTDSNATSLYINSAAHLLAIHLLKFYGTKQPVFQEYGDGLSQSRLKQVIEYIRANIDRDLSLENLAELVQMSTFYFARLFKQSTGYTPHQYIIRCRIDRAEFLLRQGTLSIVEICQQVGFQSQSHFTQLFRKYKGITPKKYRENW